ncbi:Maf-like protein, partial [candidate division WOR-3 bacterium]|nr:Maf-like protein [candidate division WOR-3 bacterium]
TPEPYDKAGAYGIQEGAGIFVSRVGGCYLNVVGLPVRLLLELLARAGLRAG